MTAFSISAGQDASGGGAAGLTPVSTPTIVNLELSILGTEYAQVVPTGTKRIFIKNRDNRTIHLAYTAGNSITGPFLLISPGSSYSENDLDVTTLTLYIQCPTTNNTICEIIFWS